MDFALNFGIYAGIIAGISVSLFLFLFRVCYIYQIECEGIKSGCDHKKIRIDTVNNRRLNSDVKINREALRKGDTRYYIYDKNKRDFIVQYGVMLKPFTFTLKFLRIGIYFRWFNKRKRDTSYAYDILQIVSKDRYTPEYVHWTSLNGIGMMIWLNKIDGDYINLDKKFFYNKGELK